MIPIEALVDYCMTKPGVIQDFPFDKVTMVFKLQGKMFALVNIKDWNSGRASLNLKNHPEKNIKLREQYAAVIPGYHMNKKHWNTINIFEEELSDDLIYQLLDESYEIIKNNLPKKLKNTPS